MLVRQVLNLSRMAIDWNDPTVLVTQYCTSLFPPPQTSRVDGALSTVDFIKLQHALGGVLIWELVTSAAFDWNLVKKISQQQGQAKWAKWVRDTPALATCRMLMIDPSADLLGLPLQRAGRRGNHLCRLQCYIRGALVILRRTALVYAGTDPLSSIFQINCKARLPPPCLS